MEAALYIDSKVFGEEVRFSHQVGMLTLNDYYLQDETSAEGPEEEGAQTAKEEEPSSQVQRVPKVKLRRGKDLPQPFLTLLFKAIPWVKGKLQINWRYIQLATRRGGGHHEVKGLSKWWVEL